MPKLKRFEYPTYLDPFQWGDVLDATVYGDICRQGDRGSEDCLTLNILVPDSLDGADSPRAVMIWIHGGAFVTGSGAGSEQVTPIISSQPQRQSKPSTQSHYTDGRALALHEDVIVVNINYRLGTVGFLSGIDDAPRGFVLLFSAAARAEGDAGPPRRCAGASS